MCSALHDTSEKAQKAKHSEHSTGIQITDLVSCRAESMMLSICPSTRPGATPPCRPCSDKGRQRNQGPQSHATPDTCNFTYIPSMCLAAQVVPGYYWLESLAGGCALSTSETAREVEFSVAPPQVVNPRSFSFSMPPALRAVRRSHPRQSVCRVGKTLSKK